MTLLVGTDGSGWTTSDQIPAGSGAMALWNDNGYTPVADGAVSEAYVHVVGFGTAANVKVLVYRASDRALLAESADIAASGGAGLRSAALSLSVSTTEPLILAVVPNAGFLTLRTESTGTQVVYSDVMTYATPDDPLPAGTWNPYRQFIIYLDGTTGGASSRRRLGLMGVGR